MYLIQKRYRFEHQILYSQVDTQSLYGAVVSPDNISTIGGEKWIMAGSFLSLNRRLLPRAVVISPYKGDGKLFVNNPSVFLPGDILRIIGTAVQNQAAEYLSVVEGTAQFLGTVTTVVGDLIKQSTTVTPSNIVQGNVVTLQIEGIHVSYVAQTSSVAEVTAGLKRVIDNLRPGESILNQDLLVADNGTNLVIAATDTGQIFTVLATVDQGSGATVGQVDVQVTQGIGQLQFTPAPNAPATLPIGTKVGTISDVPLGIIGQAYLLTDFLGNNRPMDLAAYNGGMVYRKALPYLDGHLVQSIPKLSYMPNYLDVGA